MATRGQVKPGDIILFKNSGWLGETIGWAEWDAGKGDYEYSHIAQAFDEGQACEMNPAVSRLYSLNEIPWDRVDIYRFNIDGKNPFEDEMLLGEFQAYVRGRLGMPYDYGFILKSLGVGLLARLGMQRWAQAWAHKPESDLHKEVCSGWAQENNETVLIAIDLFPNFKGISARPSDWPLCPYLTKIS